MWVPVGHPSARVRDLPHEDREPGFGVHDLVEERPVEVDGLVREGRHTGHGAVDLRDGDGHRSLLGNGDVGGLGGLRERQLRLDGVEVFGGDQGPGQPQRFKYLPQVEGALVVPLGQGDQCGDLLGRVQGRRNCRQLGRREALRPNAWTGQHQPHGKTFCVWQLGRPPARALRIGQLQRVVHGRHADFLAT